MKYYQKKLLGRNQNVFQDYFIAGGLAGIGNSIISCPMELVRIRLQVQKDNVAKQYNGSVDCAKKIIREHGIRGMYKGYIITVIREFFLYSFYFSSYEMIKK